MRTPVGADTLANAWVAAWLRSAAIHEGLYRRQPWVRICTSLIVQACTADAYTISPDAGYEAHAEALQTVHDNLNPEQSFQRLSRMIYRDLLVNGNWYGRVQTAPDGSFAALYRIDFRTIAPLPVDTGPTQSYLLYPNGKLVLSPQRIPAAQVIHLTLNDDGENGCGLSYLETLDMSLAVEYAMTKYINGFFINGAKAGDIYGLDTDWDEERADAERQYLKDNYSGIDQAMEPMFIPGKIKLVRDGTTLKPDMPFQKGREWNREEVCSLYSVPMSLVTSQMGTLGGNGKEQDLILFEENVVAPLQKQVFEDWQRQFVEGILGAQHVKVLAPIVSKMRLDKLAAAKQLTAIGGTGNQSLAVVNLPPVEGLDKPLFLPERLPVGIVGVPGDPDSFLITAQGALAAEVQDPLAMAGQSADQLKLKAQTAAQGTVPTTSATQADPHSRNEEVPQAVAKAEEEFGDDTPAWVKQLVAQVARRVLERQQRNRSVLERIAGAWKQGR